MLQEQSVNLVEDCGSGDGAEDVMVFFVEEKQIGAGSISRSLYSHQEHNRVT